MATLVLGAVGTAIGGPLGGALGSMLGRQVDGALFGPKPAEGPRLKELALTTSTYGQPIPRHFGRMRVGGTVIWATDLREDKDTSGGKGRPRTTTYSYSASFAVALGVGPVDAIGRIWADGNLLRGAGGDLKAAGAVRFHQGHADQAPDPLILAAEGSKCPAFRGRAYVVFEDLQLADFGNRLPALTFEVSAGEGAETISSLLGGVEGIELDDPRVVQLQGFSHEGGSYRQVLTGLTELRPLYAGCGGGAVRLSAGMNGAHPVLLPEAAAWSEGEFGQQDGQGGTRQAIGCERVEGLRYYDLERDYQPGLQRTAGRYEHGASRIVEFPGSLTAAGARELADAAAQRSVAARETMTWRLAELDPAIAPGSLVRLPGHAGSWRVMAWEWRAGGVELELERHVQVRAARQGGDAGAPWSPPDLQAGATLLSYFELPPLSLEQVNRTALFAAVRSSGAARARAALYRERQGELVPVADGAVRQAQMSVLRGVLPPSSGLRFEPSAYLDVAFAGPDLVLASATMAALADGANRLLVGEEVLQFAQPSMIAPETWRLAGLLRGRGGTEAVAMAGHPGGTQVVVLDGGLTPLEPASLNAAPQTLAALGLGDAEPVLAELRNAGASRRPLPPVHCRWSRLADGALEVRWTRRARGAWLWVDGVDTPLVEEVERYTVGVGDPAAPVASWSATEPRLVIAADEADRIARDFPGQPLWVRQSGTFERSQPTLVATLPL